MAVLTLLLAIALAGVGLKVYWLWQTGPWSLPASVKPRAVADTGDGKTSSKAAPVVVGTEVIIAKNLFDPERGASKTVEAEAGTRAAQRIRSMILLGTAILGSSRYAILQDSETTSRGAPGGSTPSGPLRLKLGESIEGFSLTEIGEKAVVFAKGPTRVEIPIDYFRKVPVAPPSPPPHQPGQPGVPGQVLPGGVPGQSVPGVVPRVNPNLPRRSRIPNPPAQ